MANFKTNIVEATEVKYAITIIIKQILKYLTLSGSPRVE